MRALRIQRPWLLCGVTRRLKTPILESNQKETFQRSERYMGERNSCLCAVCDALADSGVEPNRCMAQEGPAYQRPATQAEYCDDVFVTPVYR